MRRPARLILRRCTRHEGLANWAMDQTPHRVALAPIPALAIADR
jgi:hypothetical protein